MALGFATSVLLARVLGPESFGVYAFVFASAMVLAIPVQLGLPQLVVRETAKAKVDRQWGLMWGLWRWSNRTVVASSAVILAIGAVVLWVGAEQIGAEKTRTFLFALLFVPLAAFAILRASALRGLGRVVLGQLPESLLRPGLFLIILLAITWARRQAVVTPSQAMAGQALAAGLTLLLAVWLLARVRPFSSEPDIRSEYESRFWLRSALPLGAVAALQLVNSNADILMLGLLRSDAEVGVYRAVMQGAMVVGFGLQAVNLAVMPHLARLHAEGDKQRLQALVTRSARVVLLLALPIALVLIFFGSTLLGWFFGRPYEIGHVALTILAVGQLVNAAMGSVANLLNMTGYERDTMRGVATATVVNIVLNAVLIPFCGMAGAAVATAVTLTVWNIILWRFVRLRLGLESTAFARIGKMTPS